MAGPHELKPDPLDSLQADVDRAMIRVYSPRVLELFRDPQNAGWLEEPCGYGVITGPCGDTMQVWVKLAGSMVERATFWTDGCGSSMVCGSMATILATGRTVESARSIDQAAVLEALGGLPESEQHCALLAANTLQAALDAAEKEAKQ